ncbi:FAD-binding domain-containing protein [Maribacter sp. 2-571]|uniref:FAD-binding domain-containing protein n=1 Tax=Maribacter sp. 2-571 TaxID=3417569 RepID=UPI003D3421C0
MPSAGIAHTFPTAYQDILERVAAVDPIAYGRTRNYIDGAVTYLSPYISRGVISTKFVFEQLLERGFHPSPIEKMIQELAWRDYWQQVWAVKGNAIDTDLKHPQPGVLHQQLPKALLEARTGIEAIDAAILQWYDTGYLHNHLRMYVAAIACNIGGSHWNIPAKWMYYHLLDGDWASNALSWQWVAGSNSGKKYYANQENINRFCHTQQSETFLGVSYEVLPDMETPQVLKETEMPELHTPLPERTRIRLDEGLPVLLYNYYNLDPLWKEHIEANRILLLEPSHFKKFPVSQKCIDFVMALAANLKNVQVYVGEFSELLAEHAVGTVYYKEHPTNRHYQGIEEPRDWMFDVQGYFSSFFGFWKKCKKQLKR